MKPAKKKAQSWSVDVVLGSIIFIVAFFAFYSLLNASTNPTVEDLKNDAAIVIREVAADDSTLSIVHNNEINITKVMELKNYTYDELKRMMRIQSDFCIYLENEKGEIVLINNSYKGVGAPSINISGTPCNEK